MVLLCHFVLCAKDQAMIVNVAMGEFDFGFPSVFEYSRGFLQRIGLVKCDLDYFFRFVCVQVDFFDDFSFAVKAAYVFLVCWA